MTKNSKQEQNDLSKFKPLHLSKILGPTKKLKI